jgi:hypothetical protein
MMNVQQTPLYEITAGAGLQPRALQSDTGGLVVTVRGARILGIFLDGAGDNLLWVNPDALGNARRAKESLAAGEWNVGGDRCWLAPEIELHFLNTERPSHKEYAVPPALDPGNYTVRQESASGLWLENAAEATNLVSRAKFGFRTTRTITLCAPPIDAAGLSYVGYELSSELEITSPDRPEACYGLWHLMHLPPGGGVHIATRRKPEIVDYFATDVAGHCRLRDDSIVFPITGTAMQKLGLRAADVTGMMGYYRPAPGGNATLIVRYTAVFGGATYADYPANQRQRRDVAVQCWNNPGATPTCGEMEYHSVAATAASFFHTRDVSRTWCFGGPAERVRDIGRQLLGVREVG